jgi:hypothetical protein
MARDGVLFVSEGDSRISALDLADGSLAAQCALPEGASTPSDACLPELGTIALLGPAGIDRTVWIISAAANTSRTLPHQARRLLVVKRGQITAQLSDGTTITVMDAP